MLMKPKKKIEDEKPEEVEGTPVEEVEEDVEEVTDEEVEKSVNELLTKEMEKVQKEYQDKWENFKKEQKEMAEKRAGLHNPEVKSSRKEQNAYLRKFITALVENDTQSLKDMSGASGGVGGYLIDTELSAEIQHLQSEYGVARREMFPVQLTGNTLLVNNLSTDIDAYWTDESAAKTSDDVTLGQVTLALKKMAVIVPMSDELLEDSEVDLVSFLTERIAEKLAQKEDQAFLNGNGGSTYGSFTGLLRNVSVNSVTMSGTTFSSVDADDLIDMVDATPQGVLANAKYYMHRTIMSYIRKLKTSDNEYIYQAPSEKGPGLIWGYPVVLSEAMPSKTDTAAATAFVLFGDMRKAAWFGYKGGLRAALSNEATVRNTADNADINLFRSDMTALRIVERVGYVVVLPTAITRLKTAAASV